MYKQLLAAICGFPLVLSTCLSLSAAEPIRIVFLGDQGHHRPSDFAGRIVPIFKEHEIEVTYTEDVGVLSSAGLQPFDGLMLYANIDAISKDQEAALLEFVASGKGFIPIHCATFCFRNSDAFVALCGAQFKSHGGEVFETVVTTPKHPIMDGYEGFRSWDETYVHHKHNDQDRTVLEVRRQGKQASGNSEEPWTWIRTHGKGRVFYTAWGHDVRTWTNPGFQNLLERGLRWSVGRDPKETESWPLNTPNILGDFLVPKMTEFRKDVLPFSYIDVGAKIPNYVPGKRRDQVEAFSKMQEPLTPDESLKHYVTPEQFKLALWASEPQLAGKPIAMNWDDRGRLWICETVDYPNDLKPIGEGRDRIRICEDTDRDGTADKFTVFAEKLSIPTAIEFFRGGAIVQDGTQTVYLKDMDGDDRADLRQVLITGWALGDTHGGVSNFHYGHDNWFWAMQGYNNSQPVINGQVQPSFRMGFWRFRVEAGVSDETAPVELIEGSLAQPKSFNEHTVRVREVEFIRATNNNTWGFGMSEEGFIFGSTANGNPSNFMPIANRYYERVRGWAPSTLKMISDTYMFAAATDKVRQVDWHGGYTAGAGHALYTGRRYPMTWWNRLAFVCEPTGHLVGAFVLNRKGADYTSTSPFNLVAADDEWAAPIMAEVGPDGNMWVLDWYNYIVQHNPTPQGFQTGKGNAYESELRDKKHGRVYRLTYEGADESLSKESVAIENLARKGLWSLTNRELVQVLSHPTMRWRLMAQRMLLERSAKDAETVQALLSLVNVTTTDAIGLNVGAMHGLWTLSGLGLVNESRKDVWNTVVGGLRSSTPGVRRAAIQVLPPTSEAGKLLVQANLANDSDSQVRLAVLLKLSDISEESSNTIGAYLSENSEILTSDNWLLDAWTSATANHAVNALPPLLGSSRNWSAELASRVAIVASHLARSRPSADHVAKVFGALQRAQVDNALVVLQGLERGWPKDYLVPIDEAATKNLIALMDKLPVNGKSLVIQLGTQLGATALNEKSDRIKQDLVNIVGDEKAEPKQRIEAAKMLIAMQPADEAIASSLLSAINPQQSSELVNGFLSAMLGSRAGNVGAGLLKQISSLTPESKSTAIRVLLAKPETTLDLLHAMQAGTLTMNDLALDQQQALRDHPERKVRELVASVMKQGGVALNSDRAKLVEQWSSICEEKGDSVQGKLLFTKHCALCHQHTGEGKYIGPDLTGMAVHPKHELLLHILDPNRSVEGNFRIYSVMTHDGIVLTGMMAGESRTSIELIDSQGKRQSVQREEIDELVASRKSLMPEGFENQIDRTGMRDLLEFLTTKGKYVPLSLAKVASAVSTKGLFHDGDNGPDRLVFDDWSAKTFEDVPFVLIDPQEKRIPNIVLLNGPRGSMPPKMPKSVALPCNSSAAAIHLLSGISGWGYPASKDKTVSMIVRLKYEDGQVEDHPLLNAVHFADYIKRVDVPESKFVAHVQRQQVRYLKILPKQNKSLKQIEFIKGSDATAPMVVAVTIEPR